MTGLVERPLPGNGHGGCGRRLGETHRWKHRQGAPGRPHRCRCGRPPGRAAGPAARARRPCRRGDLLELVRPGWSPTTPTAVAQDLMDHRGATTAGSSTWVTRHGRQRTRRGRRASVAWPWSRTVRVRACPQRCSGRAHPGQASVPAARSVSARAGSAIPIIGTRWGHGARAWSTSTTGGRGHLVWEPARPGGCLRGPDRAGPGPPR